MKCREEEEDRKDRTGQDKYSSQTNIQQPVNRPVSLYLENNVLEHVLVVCPRPGPQIGGGVVEGALRGRHL